MTEFYMGDAGKVMARDAAGGSGGGVTSYAVREATPDETLAFHEQQVAATEAAAAAAKEAHAEHVKATAPEPEPEPTAEVPQTAFGTPSPPVHTATATATATTEQPSHSGA